MKTRMTIAVLTAIIPLMCGCEEKGTPDRNSSHLILMHPRHDIYGKPCRTLRFSKVKKEDERDTAMKEIARQWDRNLHLMRPLTDFGRQDISCHTSEDAAADD